MFANQVQRRVNPIFPWSLSLYISTLSSLDNTNHTRGVYKYKIWRVGGGKTLCFAALLRERRARRRRIGRVERLWRSLARSESIETTSRRATMISRETREGREEGGEADVTQKCDKKAIVISAFRHSLTHSLHRRRLRRLRNRHYCASCFSLALKTEERSRTA